MAFLQIAISIAAIAGIIRFIRWIIQQNKSSRAYRREFQRIKQRHKDTRPIYGKKTEEKWDLPKIDKRELSLGSAADIVKPPIDWLSECDETSVVVGPNWKWILDFSDTSDHELYIYAIKGWPQLLKVGIAKDSTKRKEPYYGELITSWSMPKCKARLVEYLFHSTTYHLAHTTCPKWNLSNYQGDNLNDTLAAFVKEVGETAGGITEVREIDLERAKNTIEYILEMIESGETLNAIKELSIKERTGFGSDRMQSGNFSITHLDIPNVPGSSVGKESSTREEYKEFIEEIRSDLREGWHWRYYATLQLRTPLFALEMDGTQITREDEPPMVGPETNPGDGFNWMGYWQKRYEWMDRILDNEDKQREKDREKDLDFLKSFRRIYEDKAIAIEDRIRLMYQLGDKHQFETYSLYEKPFQGLWVDNFLVSELTKIEGIGPKKAEMFYENGFKTKEQLLQATPEDLASLPGIGKKFIQKLKESLE